MWYFCWQIRFDFCWKKNLEVCFVSYDSWKCKCLQCLPTRILGHITFEAVTIFNNFKIAIYSYCIVVP